METANLENKNLPAFACVGFDALGGGYQQDGLTKREYFAAQAMQGLCVNAGRNGYKFHELDDLANKAVDIADAMMRALENGI